MTQITIEDGICFVYGKIEETICKYNNRNDICKNCQIYCGDLNSPILFKGLDLKIV